jgi:hypothetical protein
LGRVWLVYQSTPLIGNPVIYYKIFNGFVWTTEQPITPSSSKNISPSIIALSNSTLLVAWASNRTGTLHIFYKTNTGGTWSSDRQVTFSTVPDASPSAAQDQTGTIWIAWYRTVGSTASIFYRLLQGSTMGPEVQMTTNPSPNILPSVGVGLDGKVWIAWSSLRTGTYEIWYTIFTGSSRTPDTQLTHDSTDDSNANVAPARDGSVLIIWSKEIKVSAGVFEFDLFYQTTTDNGATWSTETALTSSTLFNDFDPSAIQRSDERIWLFWASDMPDGTTYSLFYIYSNQILIHDVGVAALAVNPTILEKGRVFSINATIANLGDFTETTTAVLYANSTTLLSTTFTLSPGQSMIVLFAWNTSSFAPGCYHTKAFATPVTGETLVNQADNTRTLTTHVAYQGDVNLDGSVTIVDAAIMGAVYGTTPASPNWNPNADVNHDGVVNIVDFAILGANFQKSIPSC